MAPSREGREGRGEGGGRKGGDGPTACMSLAQMQTTTFKVDVVDTHVTTLIATGYLLGSHIAETI